MNPIMRHFSLETYSELFQQKNFQFWALQFLGWGGWASLFFLRDVYWGQAFERILLLGFDAAVGFLLTTGLRYFYHAIWEKPLAVRIIGILAGSYLVAAIWQPSKNFAQYMFYDDFRAVEEYGYMKAYFGNLLGYSYFLILGWSGLYFGMKFYRLLQEAQQRSVKAESMAHEAQLRMLRYQLNPHFLFNTLNAISTLILEQNTSVANQMVSKLSNFLRYSLDKDPMQKVDLDHEISTMKLYLEIEKVRFEDRLKVEINVTDEAAKALVPSLILQPLVENSIKYAIASRIEGGTITINAKKYAGDLLIEVIDDGPGLGIKPGEVPVFDGVGIVNTRERLAELYGASHSCKFLPSLPHGLQIEIRLPYERL